MKYDSKTNKLVYDSLLEKVWYEFQMDTLSGAEASDYWTIDSSGNFIFNGKFKDFVSDLKYFCVLSIEQNSTISFEDGFDGFFESGWPLRILRVIVDKFNLKVVYIKTAEHVKEKTKKKLYKRFINIPEITGVIFEEIALPLLGDTDD